MSNHMMLLVVLALLAAVNTTVAEELAVAWKLVQPFRFFKNEIDYQFHYAATQPVKKPSDIEEIVNNDQWLGDWYRKNESSYQSQYSQRALTR